MESVLQAQRAKALVFRSRTFPARGRSESTGKKEEDRTAASLEDGRGNACRVSARKLSLCDVTFTPSRSIQYARAPRSNSTQPHTGHNNTQIYAFRKRRLRRNRRRQGANRSRRRFSFAFDIFFLTRRDTGGIRNSTLAFPQLEEGHADSHQKDWCASHG